MPAAWVPSACTGQSKLKPTTKKERFLAGRNDERTRDDSRNQLSVINLEVKNDAGGDAQVVLILRACAQFVEMRHEVVHLHRAN